MASTLNVLFSQPPSSIPKGELVRWYEAHLREEMLSVPTFLAAQLFRIDAQAANEDLPMPFEYALVYEVEGSWADAVAEMEKANLGSLEQYSERKKTNPSGPPIPDWLLDVRFGWWNGVAATDRLVTTKP